MWQPKSDREVNFCEKKGFFSMFSTSRYVMKFNSNVSKCNGFYLKLCIGRSPSRLLNFLYRQANCSLKLLILDFLNVVFLYYKDCFSFNWRICFKDIFWILNPCRNKAVFNLYSYMFTGYRAKHEIWTDWPLTYYRLTDKPNFDKADRSSVLITPVIIFRIYFI